MKLWVPSRGANLITGCCGFLIGLALLGPDPAQAQLLQGAIDGNVTDASQAAVAGAKVEATNLQTNFTRDTVTNSAGGYSLPTLPPGTYTVTVTASGFQTYTQTGVAVEINNITRVNVALRVGQLTESVTVQAQVGNLQTDRAEVRSEVTSQTLSSTPVPIGRNYQMIFVTLPGVSPPTNANSFGANPSRAVSFSVNGNDTSSNDTRIDGTSARNYDAGSVVLYVPALEAIESVNVVSNSFDAEQGFAGGAAINLQIKSGSNAIHGSMFAYHANQHLKAYAWASDRTQAKPKYIYNQFGATIGGPIKKDKLFYFVSYEGTRYRETTSVFGQVPTAAMKTGDLSRSPTDIYDPLTGSADGSNRTAFLDKRIPLSQIDSGVQKLVAAAEWGNPNQPGTGTFGLGRNFLNTASGGQRRDQWDTKLNWNSSSKLTMFARFAFNDNAWDTPQLFGTLGGAPLSRTNTAVGIGFGHIFSGTVSATYVFNANLIVDAYYGHSRNDASTRQQRLDENLGWTVLAIPGLRSSQTREGGWPRMAIDGFGVLGPANNFQPQDYRNPEKQYVANATWLKGAHNVRAGFELDLQHINENQEQATFCAFCTGSGGFQFSQGTTQLRGGAAGNDFNAFGAFLLGLPSNAGAVRLFPDEYFTRYKTFGLYVRDRWQVTPKLTVSYGVRWEYFPFPTRLDRGLETYDSQKNQMLVCGIGSTPSDCGITKDKQRFTPRAGVAYRLTNSTVIRAGYGITNDANNPTAGGRRQNFPDILGQFLISPNTFSYATTLRQGLPIVSAPNLTTGVVSIPGNVGVYTYDNDNYIRGYIQSWNFTLEQRLGSWIASAGYVATRAVDPVSNLEQNWSPIGGGTAGQMLTLKSGRTATTLNIGTQGTNKYDSLQMRAQRRYSNGFQVVGSYTYAKGLGYSTAVAIPAFFRFKNYGPLANDIRHNVGITAILEAPFGKGKPWVQTGPAAKVLGGWQINGLSSFYSGRPFTAGASNTTLNATGSAQFADCLSTPNKLGSIFQWYERTAFAGPTTGRFGTCGAGSLRGPGLINVDLGVDRKFPIRERFELKFRAEMFNVGNTPHHTMVSGNASVNASTFMQVLDISNTGREGLDERNFRFSLRLGW